jgi:periplasmic divalent cation tolerance protein
MYVVFVTAPREKAQEIARYVVEKKLVACVNIVDVRSIYTWKGKVEETDEALLIMKTREPVFARLKKEVSEIHPYDVPEIIGFPITKSSEKYLKWVEESTSQ